MNEEAHLSRHLFEPTEADVSALMAWFKNYDSLAADNNADEMVEEAHLPITVITDDSRGECVTQQWSKDSFHASIKGSAPGPDIKIENNRRPFFLSDNLAVVVTESMVSQNGEVRYMRYADVLAKKDGKWKFKCMIQAGWGDMLKKYFGA
jgi:hypothetical protein